MNRSIPLLFLFSVFLSSCLSPESLQRAAIESHLESYLDEKGDALWEAELERWQLRKEREALYSRKYKNERQDFQTKGLPAWGPEEAHVSVIAFLDIDDIYSQMVFSQLEAVKRRYGDQVTFFYGYNPQNNLANSMSSARSVWALDQQGAAWPFVRWSLSVGNMARTKDIEEWVQAQDGIDLEKFRADRDSSAAEAAVLQSEKQALSLGLNNTPALLFEGVGLKGVQTLDHYIPMLEFLLGAKAPL